MSELQSCGEDTLDRLKHQLHVLSEEMVKYAHERSNFKSLLMDVTALGILTFEERLLRVVAR